MCDKASRKFERKTGLPLPQCPPCGRAKDETLSERPEAAHECRAVEFAPNAEDDRAIWDIQQQIEQINNDQIAITGQLRTYEDALKYQRQASERPGLHVAISAQTNPYDDLVTSSLPGMHADIETAYELITNYEESRTQDELDDLEDRLSMRAARIAVARKVEEGRELARRISQLPHDRSICSKLCCSRKRPAALAKHAVLAASHTEGKKED